ncbi:MAG TPA: Spy/CpxP family protein refolding chaperone [Thermoanaerobaculia bacterium]|nr:Spy/CpxP family protein refolding chaperone [Thermoanaerobaculia bacterium]
MRTKTLALALLAAATLFALSTAPAFAQDDDYAISLLLGKPGRLSHALALTADQVDKFRAFAKTANGVAKPLLGANVTMLAEIQGQFDAASPDTCHMGQLALTRHQNWLKAKAAYLAFDKSFSAILTPDQLAEYAALKTAAAEDNNPFDGDGSGSSGYP